LQRFPGRTLEELDQMDWGRYLQAVSAGNTEALERRRQRFKAGEIKATSIDSADWDAIKEHDALFAEYYGE